MDNKLNVNILIDILVKKNTIMENLIQLTEMQRKYIAEDSLSTELFEEILDKKSVLIDKINQLDAGFERLFLNFKNELSTNLNGYVEQVQHLQELIKQITEKSSRLMIMEKQNKTAIELFFVNQKKGIKEYKVNSRMVSNYYKNMEGQYNGQSYFLDKKNKF